MARVRTYCFKILLAMRSADRGSESSPGKLQQPRPEFNSQTCDSDYAKLGVLLPAPAERGGPFAGRLLHGSRRKGPSQGVWQLACTIRCAFDAMKAERQSLHRS